MYYASGNLVHNGKKYVIGEKVELTEDQAKPLLEIGVISKKKVEREEVETEPAPVEKATETVQPVVGGEQDNSGEPSLNKKTGAASQRKEAKDVTPPVDTTDSISADL